MALSAWGSSKSVRGDQGRQIVNSMLVKLPHGLRILPIRSFRGETIVLENGFPVLGGEVEKLLERSAYVFLVGEDLGGQIPNRFGNIPKRFLCLLELFLSLQAPAKCIGVEDAVGVRRWNVVCRGLISTAAFRFLI